MHIKSKDFCSFVITGDGLVDAPLQFQGKSQVVMRRGKTGIDQQCPAIAGDGVVQVALGCKRDAQVVMRRERCAILPDCVVPQHCRSRVQAAAVPRQCGQDGEDTHRGDDAPHAPGR